MAFENGRYAQVRTLASAALLNGDDVDARRFLSLVQVEKTQFLIGVGAVLMVLAVAAFTLHT